MVKPKQKRVEEAREALKLAENSLAQKQASLKKVRFYDIYSITRFIACFCMVFASDIYTQCKKRKNYATFLLFLDYYK